jgi:hypothetical protein
MSIAAASPAVRSKMTNGTVILPNIDGRSAGARRFRDLARSLADDLGGPESLSEAQLALVRQAASAIFQSEKIQAAAIRGEPVDFDQAFRASLNVSHALGALGLGEPARADD